MNKADIGLIVAAGKQSRFKDDCPKALMPINDTCLLDINYNNLNKYCNSVYVVCSNENQSYFDDSKYEKIVIKSGLGSGDAALQAIDLLLTKKLIDKDSSVIVMWGDALVNDKVFDILVDKYDNKTLIPCIKENNPYVQIIPNNDKVEVRFSKYKDSISDGYHDMCIFILPVSDFIDNAFYFYSKFYSKLEEKYNHKHNEFEFLDIFNDTYIKASILELDESLRTYSFNTIEEYKDIIDRHNI